MAPSVHNPNQKTDGKFLLRDTVIFKGEWKYLGAVLFNFQFSGLNDENGLKNR